MNPGFFLNLLSIAFLLFVMPLTGLADTNRYYCPEGNAVISFSDTIDVKIVCQAVVDTRDFLEAYGLNVGGAIKIQIINEIPRDKSVHMLGYYDHYQEQIYVLNLTTCIKNKVEMFGLPLKLDLYKSFLIHEISHAIASKNFSVKQTLIPHEYIAYVTQLSTMPLILRNKVLENFPGEGFTEVGQINPIFFLLSPERFAVKAYRHFGQQADAAAFLQRLLKKEFTIDPYP